MGEVWKNESMIGPFVSFLTLQRKTGYRRQAQVGQRTSLSGNGSAVQKAAEFIHRDQDEIPEKWFWEAWTYAPVASADGVVISHSDLQSDFL